VTISRFDLLCEKGSGPGFHEGSVSEARVLGGGRLRLDQCKAITHPSNNAIFLIEGGQSLDRPQQLYLFDNQNDIIMQKPSCP
jgi:hypothetical protein